MDTFVSSSIWVIGLYFLPSIIAIVKKTKNYGSVIVVNLFLGWTIIGWIVALAMSVRTDRSSRQAGDNGVAAGQTLPPPITNGPNSSDVLMTGARLVGNATGRIRRMFEGSSQSPQDQSKGKPIYRRWWIWVVLGSILFYVVMPKVGTKTANDSTTPSKGTTTTETTPATPWTANLKPGVSGPDISAPLCPDLGSFIETQLQIITDRLNQTEKPMNDAFESADYLKKIDWEAFKHKEDAIEQQLSITTPALLSNSTVTPTDDQAEEFLQDTITACGFEDDAQKLTKEAIRLDTRLQSMQLKANNLPWYPKGFSTYSDTIAYRWLERGEFSCSYGDHCWGMLVVAKNGCPSSLYAEITILDSAGSNIGFTNDTTSGLGQGQQAKLIFEDFTPGAQKARLSEISCY